MKIQIKEDFYKEVRIVTLYIGRMFERELSFNSIDVGIKDWKKISANKYLVWRFRFS